MDARRTPPAAWRFDRFTLDLARGALLGPDGAEVLAAAEIVWRSCGCWSRTPAASSTATRSWQRSGRDIRKALAESWKSDRQ